MLPPCRPWQPHKSRLDSVVRAVSPRRSEGLRMPAQCCSLQAVSAPSALSGMSLHPGADQSRQAQCACRQHPLLASAGGLIRGLQRGVPATRAHPLRAFTESAHPRPDSCWQPDRSRLARRCSAVKQSRAPSCSPSQLRRWSASSRFRGCRPARAAWPWPEMLRQPARLSSRSRVRPAGGRLSVSVAPSGPAALQQACLQRTSEACWQSCWGRQAVACC